MDLASLTLRELTDGVNGATGTTSVQGNGKDVENLPKGTLRRCRTREQGMALMTISHAIEYLLDSHLVQQEETSDAEREALAILLTANLGVYREGAEVVPFFTRLRQWFRGGAAKKETADAAA